MKKTVSLLLLFAVLLALFCACKKNGETQPTSSPEPTTWGLILDELPDIGKYKSADSPRMFDKYVDNLIPRSDYGELMPYLGSVVQYENVKGEDEYMSEMIRGYYGLCTVDGVIVTDPVYDSIEYFDGYYLLEKCYRKDDLFLADYFLIPKDGSSIFEFPKKKSAFYCGDGVFGCCDSLYESVAASETSYYSATGKYLFTVDENSVVSDFFNGTALLSVYGSDSEYYIINKSGKRIKKFEYGVAAAVSTAPGEFAVYGADGKCGLYRGEKQILPREYDGICSDDYGNIFVLKNKTVTVFDKNKKVKATFDVSGNISSFMRGVSPLGDLLFISDTDTVYNFSGKTRQCDWAEALGGGLYLLRTGSKQTVVDKNLKTVCDVPEDCQQIMFCESEKYLPCLFNDDGSGYYYRLLDKNSGKLSDEKYQELLNRKYLLKKNEDGGGFSVIAPDDLSVIRTYDTFIDSVETSRGTLYVYDCDGYVWTVDSDWNVLCRTTMNLTD